MTTQITNLFNSRAGYRSHIWLEGKRLTDHGFEAGSKYKLWWLKDRLIVTDTSMIAVEGAIKSETRKVNQQRENPAIRITGKGVQALFGDKFLNVRASFGDRSIEIVGHDPVYVRSIPEGVDMEMEGAL